MRDKKGSGAISEMVFMMYRIVLITFVGFLVMGVSVLGFNQDLNVKNVESFVLMKNLYNCVVFNSEFFIPDDYDEDLYEYCGYSDDEMQRFYGQIKLLKGEEVLEDYSFGDSGKKWIYDIMQSKSGANSNQKTMPGYYEDIFNVTKNKEFLQLKIGVLTTDDE